jgi:hypothetical protein
MNEQSCASPETGFENKQNKSPLRKWFEGDIKLWKAIVLLQIVGWIILLAISTSLMVVIPLVVSIALKTLLLPAFAIYSSICVYRASPNPKVSIKGAIAKLWAVIFVIYGFGVTYYSITSILNTANWT